VPKVDQTTFLQKVLHGYEGIATIHNKEEYPLVLTGRAIHAMSLDDDDRDIPDRVLPLRFPIIVPGQGSLSIPVSIPAVYDRPDAVGFGVTYLGETIDKKKIRAECYFDKSAKDQKTTAPKIADISVSHLAGDLMSELARWRKEAPRSKAKRQPVASGPVGRRLSQLRSGSSSRTSTVEDIAKLDMVAQSVAEYRASKLQRDDKTSTNVALVSKLLFAAGTRTRTAEITPELKRLRGIVADHIADQGFADFAGGAALYSIVETPPPPIEGEECDPDNVPDEVLDDLDTDWVCQATPEEREVATPGRFLNARKGDIVLSPGGPSLIGQLLRQVSPPQRYSHSGIMTRNYDQITHCTASEERILAYPVGNIPGHGPAPTDGHRPDVVKYAWPGVITQTVEDSLHGGQFTDPESGKFYALSGFARESTSATLGGNWEIIHPLVIKPAPEHEAADSTVRQKLRKVASDALAHNGKCHYRFFCYTDPTVFFDQTKMTPMDSPSRWARGLKPAVCAPRSFGRCLSRTAYNWRDQAISPARSFLRR
jgi:hypothetical protein